MGRSPCCDKAHTNKGAWTKDEDHRLISYIHSHGEGCWRSLPKSAGLLRCGKSCRLRWINYLRPDLKRGNFTDDEEDLIIRLHSLLGNKWSLIAGRLPGRTDNEIKNYWNTHIKRKLFGRGIDPQNHRTPPAAAAVFSPAAVAVFSPAAVAEAVELSETCRSEGSSGGGGDLSLELSISLPYYSSPQPSPRSDDGSTAVVVAARVPEICFCNRLGFRGGEACVCESIPEQKFLRLAMS